MKGNEKVKGRWTPKWEILKYAGEKENVVPYKDFNTNGKGPREKHTRRDGRELLYC